MGTGPGATAYLSGKALEVLSRAEVVVGYKTYVDLIEHLLEGKEVLSTGMTREIERCTLAVDRARQGDQVAVISSGDPGVYGMAGLVLEILEREGLLDTIPFEVVPGITSATAAAARLGAPLMHDFAVISLSDLLTPWEVITARLELVAQGDFVVVLYNPASHRRRKQIEQAREIMLKYRDPSTPVGVVRNLMRDGEARVLTDLARMLEHNIDMLSTVIVGNRSTRQAGDWLITPRGYRL